MEQLGIMLYGYDKNDAKIIKSTLESVFNCDIIMLSGSCKESHIVEEILSDETYDTYEDKELKVLMFLDFNDNQINLTLDKFPSSDKITRPIFCGLTENNMGWTLNKLLEHLIEERSYWNNKNK